MKVIFLQNIKGVARIGDIKNVNDGYARNFLFPKNFARPATTETIKQAEVLKNKHNQEYAVSKEDALKLVEKLGGLILEIKEDTNEEGHLYGSVGEKKIIQALKKEKINIEEDQVNLPEHIKTVGEHEVELELHPEVKTKIKIVISAK